MIATDEGRFRAVLGLSTALMIGLSYPLWIDLPGSTFPRVPFVARMPMAPSWLTFARFSATLLALISASVGYRTRWSLGVALTMLAWSVAEDQFRLQPWVYQFLLMGFVLANAPSERALGLCRVVIVALYFHSGLSKLDRSFEEESGRQFLGSAVSLLGGDLRRWSGSIVSPAVRLMPAWEISVAVGLVFRTTRRLALVGAVLQHLALIAILGPWGLRHSTIVLVWNAAMIAEVVVLFRSPVFLPPGDRPSRLAGLVVALAVLLPSFERFGLWDTWPSFGLYASHNERASVYVDVPEALEGAPPFSEIAAYLGPPTEWGTRRWLDLARWSLTERGVPLYPQGRALNGVAEVVASRYEGIGPVLLRQIRRADPRTGRRREVDLVGLDAIRRHGDSYWLNAHPAR